MKKLIIVFVIFCSVLSAQDDINVMSYYASDNSLDGQPRIDMTNILRFFPVYAILNNITEVYVIVYYGSEIKDGYADKMSGGDYWQILLPDFHLGESIQRIEVEMTFNLDTKYYTKYFKSAKIPYDENLKSINSIINNIDSLTRIESETKIHISSLTHEIEVLQEQIKSLESENREKTDLVNELENRINLIRNKILLINKIIDKISDDSAKTSAELENLENIRSTFLVPDTTVPNPEHLNFLNQYEDSLKEKINEYNFSVFRKLISEVGKSPDEFLNKSARDSILVIDKAKKYLEQNPATMNIVGFKAKRKNLRDNYLEYLKESINNLTITQRTFDFINLKINNQIYTAENKINEYNNKQLEQTESLAKEKLELESQNKTLTDEKLNLESQTLELDKKLKILTEKRNEFEKQKEELEKQKNSLSNKEKLLIDEKDSLDANKSKLEEIALDVKEKIFKEILGVFSDSTFSGPAIRKSDLIIEDDFKSAKLLYRYYKNNLRYRKALDPAENLGIFRARYIPLPVVGTPRDNKVQLLRPMESKVPVVFEVGLAFGDEVVSGDNTFEPALSLSRLGVAIVITEKLFKADAEILGIAFTYDFNSYASIGFGRNLAQGQSYPYFSFGINKKAFEQLLVGLAGLFK